jgi:A/G-specific adenine glycosylase
LRGQIKKLILKKLIIKGMDKRYFSKKIVEWYQENKRNLPWRETKDPYKIWLSEVILQQTRVAQGLPYYLTFVAKYPTVQELAHAPEQEVLRVWQGLGYYTRARNLHKCAKVIAESLNGKFPDNYEALKELPGVGDYTAAAIASISFYEPVAVVDGNVYRVLARLHGIETPINSPDGRKVFCTLANTLVSTVNPDLHNQAMMEFGATFCTPQNPKCEQCPFLNCCVAAQRRLQHLLPVKLKLKKAKNRYFDYLVFKKGKSLLMKKRVEKDIWHGLYDFPLLESKKPVSLKTLLKKEAIASLITDENNISVTDTYKHVLTPDYFLSVCNH